MRDHRKKMDDMFDSRMRSFKLFHRAVSLIVGVGIVASIAWAVMVYQDCRADGLRLYQCAAVLNNPQYIAVDSLD